MKLTFLTILLILHTLNLFAKEDNSYEKGKTIYYANGCANCHGTNAEGSNYYPSLANKEQKYLTNKINNFKKGIATTQKQEIMFTFVNALSKDDIQNLTKFLTHFTKEDSDKYDVEEDLLGVDY